MLTLQGVLSISWCTHATAATPRQSPGGAAEGTDGDQPAAGGDRRTASSGSIPRTYVTGAERDAHRAAARSAHERAIAALQNARSAESAAKRRLDELNREGADIEKTQRSLGSAEQSAVDRVAVARRHAREYAVEAYIGGGPPSFTDYFLSTRDANDLAWRSWIVRDHVGRAYESADELAEVRTGVGLQVDEVARRLDRNRSARQDAQNDVQRAKDGVTKAEDDLADAEQKRRDVELEAGEEIPPELFESMGFRGAGDDGSPTPDQSGNAKGPGWAALRHCESSGNYNIVDSTGTYRGAYQFDLQTWRSVGGHGDPIDNSTAEQDLRAQILYDNRGPQPWPLCGRHLRPPVDPATSSTSSTSTTLPTTSSVVESSTTTSNTTPGPRPR